MNNDDLSKQKIALVLKTLDQAIHDDIWRKSNFLQVIGRKLSEIRSDFIREVDESLEQQSKLATTLSNRLALKTNQVEVFVSLYTFEGTKLSAWERILINLPRQMISRPIYSSEDDVKANIRSKENKINEAFVSIHVNPSDILPMAADKIPRDKSGKTLMVLKDNSLSLNNVNYFWHEGRRYQWVKGQLVTES